MLRVLEPIWVGLIYGGGQVVVVILVERYGFLGVVLGFCLCDILGAVLFELIRFFMAGLSARLVATYCGPGSERAGRTARLRGLRDLSISSEGADRPQKRRLALALKFELRGHFMVF